MVLPKKPGRAKRGKTRGRANVQIRTSVPYDENEVVGSTRVVRKANGRVFTATTKAVVPLEPSIPLDLPEPLEPPNPDIQPTDELRHKKPSRSVAVCFIPHPSLPLAPDPCACSRLLNSGSHIGRNLLTSFSSLKHCI